MLFNSYEFLFLFLPITVIIYFLLGYRSILLSSASLALMSIVFYAYWSPVYVFLLLASITINFFFGVYISKAAKFEEDTLKKVLLWIAITGNLVLLAYFKYANFFIGNINVITGISFHIKEIILPLGISFFTFTQIAFLVDSSRGVASEPNFVHYLLFVTYFPHLIAGPVLHHSEMMPQFAKPSTYRLNITNFEVGASIFAIGLFKKVILADGVAVHSTTLFATALSPEPIDFYQAWGGTLCYTLQLYFDFSGYSDMAIGISRIFGVLLPLNFNSPYKAINIIDFWRRWHMTLSRFLKDYLYIPLGGNRKGPIRRMLNLFITMLLGGLWHGAGWTFIVWGGLHGLYLVLNHIWRTFLTLMKNESSNETSFLGAMVGRLLTFIAVVFAWVFFRAENIESASRIITAMITLPNYIPINFTLGSLPYELLNIFHWRLIGFLRAIGIEFSVFKIHSAGWLFLLLPVIWIAPNTQEIMSRFQPALDYAEIPEKPHRFHLTWQLSSRFSILAGLMTLISLLGLNRISEFLYFQF